MIEVIQDEFDCLYQQNEEKKQKILLRRLEDLERESRIRMAQGVVYASIENVDGGWEWNDYDSLIADYEYDLTKWVIEKPGGMIEPYSLSRLSMYPMILAETNRMGFARIAKTRITYIRKKVDWEGRSLVIGNKALKISVEFPKTKTKTRNIVVKLTNKRFGSCKAAFLFTGDTFHLVRKRYFKGHSSLSDDHASLVIDLDNEFFASQDKLNNFFKKYITDFTYAELGRYNKNVRDYLKGKRFRISIIQFQGNPILVIKKQS